MKASFLKKVTLFNSFRRTLKKNKQILQSKFNLRIDNASRLYTVVNVPEELIGEAYSLKKSDIDRISENYLREYSRKVTEHLNSIKLQELFEVYEIKKVDKYSYLIIIGFSLFKSTTFYNRLYYVGLPTAVVSSLILLLLLL
jgi:hypothetical protein